MVEEGEEAGAEVVEDMGPTGGEMDVAPLIAHVVAIYSVDEVGETLQVIHRTEVSDEVSGHLRTRHLRN